MDILITLPGIPRPKGRPNFGKGRTYTPASTKSYETTLKLVAKGAMGGRAPLHVPVAIVVRAFFPVPDSWSKAKQDRALGGRVFPTGRPDADNILKSIDALNGVVWVDDAQVVDARVIKLYSQKPRLEIAVGVRVVPPSSTGEVTALSESALQKVWDNYVDAIYDTDLTDGS